MAEWHPAFEEYTETIFELEEDGIRVVQARIADRLSVSRPAVSEMVHRMQREGLLKIEKGVIALTETGRNLAQRTVRRHRLAERFLTDILGLVLLVPPTRARSTPVGSAGSMGHAPREPVAAWGDPAWLAPAPARSAPW